ncbi:MAG: 3'-5' exoribonuclease YhaM family protein [Syntrophomonadaceae bacterium]
MKNKEPLSVKEIKQQPVGQQFWGKYLIMEAVFRKTRDGREIANLKIGDSSGEIDVVVWDNCQVSGKLEEGLVIGLLGDISSYNNRLQVTAKRIKILDEEKEPYLKGPEEDMSSLIDKFNQILASVTDPYLQKLLITIFKPEIFKSFCYAPAARKIHHNYRGGLLEHTVSVANLCLKTAKSYPYLNQDLIIAGALLHDIGKIRELEIKAVPQYSVEGRLIGHIVKGAEMAGLAIAQIRSQGQEFPEKLEWMVRHMILSHHGSLEFGSPVLPLFPEAFLLFMMDNLDAKMFIYREKIEQDDPDEMFTNYDNFLGQVFFKYRYPGPEGPSSL